MTILGAILALTGITISILTLLHDLRRIQVSLLAPQGAPSRLPPEIHVLAAILNGVGWIFLRGWAIGCLVLIGHVGIAIGLAPLLIERSVIWFTNVNHKGNFSAPLAASPAGSPFPTGMSS